MDDGGSVDLVGGQSRATYSTLQSTVTSAGGNLALSEVSTLISNVQSGSIKPSLGLCSEAVWNFIEQLIAPQERIVKDEPSIRRGVLGGSGFTALFYRGIPIVADEKATAQTLFMINEDFLEFHALPLAMTMPIKFRSQSIKGNDYSNVEGLGFSWSDWINFVQLKLNYMLETLVKFLVGGFVPLKI